MREDLESEIADLRQEYQGLTRARETEIGLVVSGALPFEASTDGHETIADVFEIDLVVPETYPEGLPWVLETSGRISDAYEHVYTNGKLCLAVPTEERLIFRQEPCLRGFVTNLVIPYCYGYCYWERHRVHPFGEREHGGGGIARFYIDRLGLAGEIRALEVAFHLFKYGYRGHHDCPCGNGSKLRDCHGPALLELHRNHTAETARFDLVAIFTHCANKADDGELEIPEQLRRRVLQQLGKAVAASSSQNTKIQAKRN